IGTAAAAMAVGIALAAIKLPQRHAVIAPLLDESKKDIDQMPRMTPAQRSDAASRLLDKLALVDFQGYGPWWIPSSWVTGFNGRLSQALGRSFETIVFSAVHQ